MPGLQKRPRPKYKEIDEKMPRPAILRTIDPGRNDSHVWALAAVFMTKAIQAQKKGDAARRELMSGIDWEVYAKLVGHKSRESGYNTFYRYRNNVVNRFVDEFIKLDAAGELALEDFEAIEYLDEKEDSNGTTRLVGTPDLPDNRVCGYDHGIPQDGPMVGVGYPCSCTTWFIHNAIDQMNAIPARGELLVNPSIENMGDSPAPGELNFITSPSFVESTSASPPPRGELNFITSTSFVESMSVSLPPRGELKIRQYVPPTKKGKGEHAMSETRTPNRAKTSIGSNKRRAVSIVKDQGVQEVEDQSNGVWGPGVSDKVCENAFMGAAARFEASRVKDDATFGSIRRNGDDHSATQGFPTFILSPCPGPSDAGLRASDN